MKPWIVRHRKTKCRVGTLFYNFPPNQIRKFVRRHEDGRIEVIMLSCDDASKTIWVDTASDLGGVPGYMPD